MKDLDWGLDAGFWAFLQTIVNVILAILNELMAIFGQGDDA